MKGIVVTTENTVEVKDFGEPWTQTVGEIVGGYVEIVCPVGLAEPLCMVVNEEGLLLNLPVNTLGSLLYGAHIHGNPIVGNLVILKRSFGNLGVDIVGLTDAEAAELTKVFEAFFAGPNKNT